MQDLIGGRIDFVAEQISTALPQIQSNTVKAIATLGLEVRTVRARGYVLQGADANGAG